MKKGLTVVTALILIFLYTYFIKAYFCREIRIPYLDPGTSLNETKLSYSINYGENNFTIEGIYDILFLPRDSSTNGVPFSIVGNYGESVKSEELFLRGSGDYETNSGLRSSVKNSKKYYVSGVVNRPVEEYVRKQNEKALSIHVEEHYYIDYSP